MPNQLRLRQALELLNKIFEEEGAQYFIITVDPTTESFNPMGSISPKILSKVVETIARRVQNNESNNAVEKIFYDAVLDLYAKGVIKNFD